MERMLTHGVRISGPVPRKRIDQLPAQEVYRDIVDRPELSKDKVDQDLIAIPNQGPQPLRVLSPAIARNECSRLPSTDISEGRVYHSPQRTIRVSLPSDNIERLPILVQRGSPPGSTELHTYFDGRPVAELPEGIRLHGRESGFGQIEGPHDGERDGGDDVREGVLGHTVCRDLNDIGAGGGLRESDAGDAGVEGDSVALTGTDVLGHRVGNLEGAATRRHHHQ